MFLYDELRMTELISEYSLAEFEGLSGGVELRGDFLQMDEVTQTHCRQTATCTENIARANGGSLNDILDMSRAALGHDMGKAWLSQRIVTKPDLLTDSEMAVMRTHTVLGEKLMRFRGISDPLMLAACVGHHSLSGSGHRLYPKPIESPDEIVKSMHTEMIDGNKVTLDIWHMFMNGLEALGIV